MTRIQEPQSRGPQDLDSEPLSPALDAALARSLVAPPLPSHFHAGLRAAIARSAQADLGELRERYEREQAQSLAALKGDYVRVKRRLLGSMIGGAFAAGAAVALVMPWVTAHFGARAPFIVACCGAAVGLGLGYLAWQRGRDDALRA